MAIINRRNGIIGGVLAAAVAVGSFFALSGDADLQSRINAAQCGEVIELEAGTITQANITLPKKDCTEFITIRSSRANELPEGQRVNPTTQSALFAKLQSVVNAEPVIKTAAGAHHYKFIGVEISTANEGVFVYDLVRLGGSRHEQTTLESVPHHLVIDRSYVHGNGNQETQRGVTLNCADCGVTNSNVSNIKAKGMDTQAVCGWNGTLRAYVLNSELVATGENAMWGGADPAQESMIPRNAELRRNSIWKPMEWKGQGYTIKNLVELKNCIGCTIDGNIIENNWGGEGQSGIAIVITVRNQDCAAPWSTIQNGSFTNNTVKNVWGAFNFLGKDNEAEPTYEDRPGHPKCSDPGETYGSVRGNAFLVANNVFDKIIGPFITINGFYSVIVENNTDLQTCTEGCNTTTFYGEPSQNYIHRNNVHDEKAYGLTGDGSAPGKPTLDRYAQNAIVIGNVVARPYAPYPPGNEHPASLTITSDYRTPYTGKGADIDAMLTAQSGGGVGVPSPSATATITVSPNSTPTAPLVVSPDGMRLPPATRIIDTEKNIWTLSGTAILKNGAHSGGGGSLVLWSGGRVYAIGIDGNWWMYTGGTSWAQTADPTGPIATPTATAVPTVAPSTPTPTPKPSVTPTATPTPVSLPFCRSGERPGTPPRCRCRNNVAVRPNGKCP